MYRTGALNDEAEECLDRVSFTDGSVVERGKAGGDNMGEVPLLCWRGRVALVGSVTRRDVGAWKGVMADVEEDDGTTAEVPTVARELVGLPLLGMLNPRPIGELGPEAVAS